MRHRPESEFLRACRDCSSTSLQCALACLEERDPKSMVRCIALCMACAAACRLATASIRRGDDDLLAVCALCVRACGACAAECARHPHAHCQRCTRACQRFAAACRAVSPQPTGRLGAV